MMTWAEFKAEIEKRGVTDESKLLYIDISGFETPEAIVVSKENAVDEWKIWS